MLPNCHALDEKVCARRRSRRTYPGRFRCHMGVNFTIRELRELEQFCLDQADQAGTPDGRAGLLILAQNYREAAERTSSPDSRARARATRTLL
jgi:hypothetical protein